MGRIVYFHLNAGHRLNTTHQNNIAFGTVLGSIIEHVEIATFMLGNLLNHIAFPRTANNRMTKQIGKAVNAAQLLTIIYLHVINLPALNIYHQKNNHPSFLLNSK